MLNNSDIEFLPPHLHFYSKLGTDEQKLITQNTVIRHYSKGDELLNGVSECSGLIIVKNGQLRAYYISEDGKQITLYRLLEGDVCIMSASCVLKNITFDVSLEFESDSDIYIIPINVWSNLSNTNLLIKEYAMELMASRFSDVMWVMEQLVFKGIGERVATFLIDESALQQSNTLATTHEVIAKNLSTAREVISRTLKHFENDGVLELSRGAIKIINFKKLRSY